MVEWTTGSMNGWMDRWMDGWIYSYAMTNNNNKAPNIVTSFETNIYERRMLTAFS